MTKLREHETYRSPTPFGLDETWTTVDHPDVPAGWRLERRTTYALICTRCERMTFVPQWVSAHVEDAPQCEYCD